MTKLINPLLDGMEQKIDPKEVIESMYTEFIEACQSPQFPGWNENSKFDDYVHASKIQAERRLRELQDLIKQKGQSMIHIVKFAESLRPSDRFEMAPDVGRKLKKEELEVLEYMIRKSLEAIGKFLSGGITLDEAKLHKQYRRWVHQKTAEKLKRGEGFDLTDNDDS